MALQRDTELSAEPAASPHGLLQNGTALGVVAAVAYSIANLALRRLTDAANAGGSGWEVWVTAVKTSPAALTAWFLVLRRAARGLPAFPPARLLPKLFLAALLMQFGGNLCFQVALGYLGVGITVPFVFACIICIGAVMGRVVLGDPLTRQVLAAMGVMMAAIVLLSIGTVSDSVTPASDSAVGTGRTLTGICIAAICGCSYGAVGVLVRSFVRSVLPVESTLMVFSTVGAVLLSGLAVSLSGWQPILTGTLQHWPVLLMAGVANTIAFFAVAHAFRFIDVNRINVINASQNAMCAVGAVVLFHEPLNRLALLGIGLTILGLIVLGRHPARKR